MASIRKKNNKWQVQVRRKGCNPISKTFTLKSDALKWARSMETNVDRHDLPLDIKSLETTTLDQLVQRYLDEIVPTKKSAKVEGIILTAFRRHSISLKMLSEISTSDWKSYCNDRLQSISSKSLARQLSPLRHMFSIAIEQWDLPFKENPLARLKLKISDKKRNRRVSKTEEAILLSIAGNTKPGYLSDVIKLAIETGMRRGEILAMRLDHVDFQRRLLDIPETKNGEARTIPLTNEALSILLDVSRKATGDRLFDISEDGLRHSWSRACRKANVENLHFHDLRHEAISRFFEMGLTTPEVALISGHKDVRMLFRYAHATQKSILGKFESLLAGN